MPTQTNLNVAPYYDDFDENKDFYKILFRPGVAVQARELNQLQSILQNQIEKFGDNIFKTGTIIDGCQFVFHEKLPYVKIKDNEVSGVQVNVSVFEDLYVKNAANLQAIVVTTLPGFESRDPDLNTLYVKYQNSGNSSTSTAFAADQVLTVFDPDNIIFKVNINDGSAGFTDTDPVVFLSAIEVQNSTGGTTFANGFYVGDRINNGLGANAVITAVDTTTNTSAVILKLRPLANNLATANSSLWSFAAGDGIVSANASPAVATITGIVGSGAAGTIVTDSVGQIDRVAITSNGRGYYIDPSVWVASTTANTLQVASANLSPQTYMTQITVAASGVTPIGYGYGMTVKEGVIYQKGYFSRVDEQLIVVERYGTSPDEVVVGFDTKEELINSNIDQSLLDNALGTFNYTAPGADRLKLTPQLVVLDRNEADSNGEFLTLVEFSEGYPFKQNRSTQYNAIGDEMARRTFDESGNYVLDPFNAATGSQETLDDEVDTFEVIVDPGKAYIDGYRVETLFNSVTTVDKGTDTQTANNQSISLSYGTYVDVKELGGTFNFSTGDRVELYANAAQYLTTSPGSTIAPVGTKIGYARIRNVQLTSGVPGTPSATYRLYLFNVEMDSGRNFQNVKSVYYNGTVDGIADIVQSYDLTTNSNITLLKDNRHNKMVFTAGRAALRNMSNVSYTYSTTSNSVTANTLGQMAITLTGTDETFAYSGTLSATTRRKLLIVPTVNAIAAANITGTITTTSGQANVTGSGTAFIDELEAGDYIKYGSSIKQISAIANQTFLQLSTTASTTGTANAQIYFPQNVPITMDNPLRSANVSANGSVLTINLGVGLDASANMSVTYDVYAANVQPQAMTVQRNSYIRLNLGTHDKSTTGPWSLGFPNVIRLRGVYKGANSSFAANGTGVVDVTNDFYVDNGQTESIVDLGKLKRKTNSILSLTGSDYLLVKFDHLTVASAGMKNVLSYLPDHIDNDNLQLANAASTIHTLEIPEFKNIAGDYYDLRDAVDFRPTVANTVAITTTANGSTPSNPADWTPATRVFVGGANKFPIPNSVMRADLEFFLGRVDRIIVTKTGDIQVIKGEAGSYTAPPLPADALNINTVVIPPYPSIPQNLSQDMVELNDVRTTGSASGSLRSQIYAVTLQATAGQISRSQPRGYSMQDIGDLERRISDLEYYVSLTLAETDVKNKVIPGVGGVDRYKFGFLVDSFNDTTTADIGHPEFSADIIDGRLQSKVETIVLESETHEQVSFPYNEFCAFTQATATDGPVPTPVTTSGSTAAPRPTTTTTTSTLKPSTTTPSPSTVAPRPTQRQVSEVIALYGTQFNTNCSVYDDREFTFSESAGSASFLFCFEDAIGVVEIYYGTTPGFTPTAANLKYTSANAVALTTAEQNELSNADIVVFPEVQWSKNIQTKSVCAGKTALDYSLGKIAWTHNPAWGRYVKVRVIRHSAYSEFFNENINKGKWRNHPPYAYLAKYPSDSTTTATTTTSPKPATLTYTSSFAIASPYLFTINNKLTTVVNGSTNYNTVTTVDSQVFRIFACGLKPNTQHTFTFDGKDNTSKCQSVAGTLYTAAAGATLSFGGVAAALGAGLFSDALGIMQFDFYYDAGIDEGASTYADRVKLIQSVVGVKTWSVQSSDGNSSASHSIEVKSYNEDLSFTPPAVTAPITPVVNIPVAYNIGGTVPVINWTNITIPSVTSSISVSPTSTGGAWTTTSGGLGGLGGGGTFFTNKVNSV